MSYDLLRQYVKQCLTEAAKTSSDAASKGYVIVSVPDDPGMWYMLVDPELFKERVENYGGVEDMYGTMAGSTWSARMRVSSFFDFVHGAILVGPPRAPGQAYNAWEVYASVADKGYGPMMYDVAMAAVKPKPLMADRRTVSKDARNIWKKYDKDRPDVIKLDLDDIDDPKTPTPVDDAVYHKKEDSESLNKAYKTKMPDTGILALMKRGEKFAAEFENSEDLYNLLATASECFFGNRYHL